MKNSVIRLDPDPPTGDDPIVLVGEWVGSPYGRGRMPMVRLSSGRVVLIGRHSYCTMIRDDGTEIVPGDEYVPVTRDEEDECWRLVTRVDEIVSLLPEEKPTETVIYSFCDRCGTRPVSRFQTYRESDMYSNWPDRRTRRCTTCADLLVEHAHDVSLGDPGRFVITLDVPYTS